MRPIMISTAPITTALESYYTAMPCGKIAFIQQNSTELMDMYYPECNMPGVTADDLAVVQVKFPFGRAEQVGAGLGIGFGMAIWMALLLHTVGVEVYLALTPRESERLRQVSYEKQLARGFKNPGSAGLTIDRWGDADEWKPMVVKEKGGAGVV